MTESYETTQAPARGCQAGGDGGYRLGPGSERTKEAPVDQAAMPERKRLTRNLQDVTAGAPGAADELFASCYKELRRLAHRYLANEWSAQSLQTTELVHEAYLRLVDVPQLDDRNRAHFFAIASRAMRRILVDRARRRHSGKRGGKARRVIDAAQGIAEPPPEIDIVALDAALKALEEEMPEKIRVVEMRFFAGMTYEEIAAVIGASPRTVRRYASYAHARLYELMRDNSTGSP